MASNGKISAAQMGFSQPIGSPPYNAVDKRHYAPLDALRFEYVTDIGAAAALLPDVFELEAAPRAYLTFNLFGFSNAGSYLEVVQGVECSYQGETAAFPIRLYMNSDTPMITGREWFGIPKLLGSVFFDPSKQTSILSGRLERPEGIPLASGVMRPDSYAGELKRLERLNWGLRILPSVSPQRPTIRELSQYKLTLEGGTVWKGEGSAHFTGASAVDPLHALPVIEMESSTFIQGTHLTLETTGEIIDLGDDDK